MRGAERGALLVAEEDIFGSLGLFVVLEVRARLVVMICDVGRATLRANFKRLVIHSPEATPRANVFHTCHFLLLLRERAGQGRPSVGRPLP